MVALYLMTDVWRIAGARPSARFTARTITWLIAAQLAAGIVNVLLLAPVWLQLVHLLLADGVWIGYVFLAADALAVPISCDRHHRSVRAPRVIATGPFTHVRGHRIWKTRYETRCGTVKLTPTNTACVSHSYFFESVSKIGTVRQ